MHFLKRGELKKEVNESHPIKLGLEATTIKGKVRLRSEF